MTQRAPTWPATYFAGWEYDRAANRWRGTLTTTTPSGVAYKQDIALNGADVDAAKTKLSEHLEAAIDDARAQLEDDMHQASARPA